MIRIRKEIKSLNLILSLINTNGKTLYGADVLTIINKAIDNNINNKVEKDKDGFYIENDTNSIKVEITFLYKDEEENIKEVVYQMENLEKTGLSDFIASFGVTEFECNKLEYNSQGKVCKIYIKQLEI